MPEVLDRGVPLSGNISDLSPEKFGLPQEFMLSNPLTFLMTQDTEYEHFEWNSIESVHRRYCPAVCS